MAAVCAMDAWKERFKENPRGRDYLANLPADKFIQVFTRWKEMFAAGGKYPVMGVTEQEFRSIKEPIIIIPGNDQTAFQRQRRGRAQTHSRQRRPSVADHRPGSAAHSVPEWRPYEEEIARAFVNFMQRTIAAEKTAA